MMDPTNGDRVFVADLAAECRRLREANVMRFGGPTATYDARQRGDEFAVLLVAQTNGLRRHPATADNGRFWSRCLGSVEGLALPVQGLSARTLDSFRRRITPLSSFDRREPLPEGALDKFSVGRGQRVLDGKVLVDPVGGVVRGFQIAQFRDQSVAQRL